ncbi:makorin, ring finger protein, 4 [Epinephelus fuscoguttatus]|uniref:makorin, ring finger protein, 4 n=1 Tax=Epinephelus fuscoguttatus TaxID=293821 RepID=UPI0020D0820D|nr:makorin, ring finger protein, 4 [Epinephelus fuscoguttatus]
MDSARSGSICRHFLNGYCRFGSRCNYRHEWPDIIPSQICRYFQKGGCWYGDSCRYLHVPQPEVDAAAAGRRGSEPTVSASSVAYTPSDRRGSEPALLQSGVTSKQECSRSQLFPISNPQHNSGRLAVDIEEEQSQDTDTPISASWESVHSSEVAQASASDGGNEQETSSNETTEDGAAAAASSTQGNIEEMEAFLQSQNVTCGICMDKVYEKTPGNQVFGILPNCNHAFCLQCIMTWRKTKDLEPDVVKSCPQCRVRSAFYVPNKHWVEGQAKESLVAAFKEKFSKKRCRYYSRYRYCPFKTDCLYRHDKTPRRGSFPYFTEDEEFDVDLVSRFIAMTLLGGYDDDSDDEDDYSSFAIFLPEEYRV